MKQGKSKKIGHADVLHTSKASLEVEQLKSDLKRLIGKSRANYSSLCSGLGNGAFSRWVDIECEIRCYLSQLSDQHHGN